jgi:hypothetical protein
MLYVYHIIPRGEGLWHVGITKAMNVSRPDSRTAPGVFYTRFYSHALSWKTVISRVSRSPNGLNHFWIQVAVSLLKPPHGGFRSETAAT